MEKHGGDDIKTILTKYKIHSSAVICNSFIAECEHCNHPISLSDDIIGWADYPKHGYRAAMNPNAIYGVVLECKKCFTKNIYHMDIEDIEFYVGWLYDDDQEKNAEKM